MSENDLDIGARLRRIRTSHNLSQRELARRAGVPHATISLIESNQTNPSVGSLKRVLDGLPMALSAFFAEDVPDEERVFFLADQLHEIGKGKISFKQIGQDLTHKSMQIMCETYTPGADTGRVMLQHEGEEGGFILQGALEVTVGAQKKVLRSGDGFYFKSETPHRFRTVGSEKCVVISACTPPSF